MFLLQLQTNHRKEQSANSFNICHVGQYIILEHTKDHMLCTKHNTRSSAR